MHLSEPQTLQHVTSVPCYSWFCIIAFFCTSEVKFVTMDPYNNSVQDHNVIQVYIAVVE